MERTQAAANRLADDTRIKVTALWALVSTGRLTRGQFRTQATAVVARANAAGVSLADIGLAAEITRHLKQPTPALGLIPNDIQVDQDRMAADIDRIVARTEDPSGELGEWAASEPLLTVATANQEAMRQRGIARWVRVLSGTSCPLCTGWADGIARSTDTPMARHIGCDCIQSPVLDLT